MYIGYTHFLTNPFYKNAATPENENAKNIPEVEERRRTLNLDTVQNRGNNLILG